MSGTNLKLDLYVRASVSGAEHSETLDRLDRLEGDDKIDEYEVHDWADRVSTEARELRETNGQSTNFALRKFEEFEDWAQRNGMSVRPYFDLREYSCGFTDEKREVVVLPVMCVAAYEDENLYGVYPCSDGDEVYLVNDYLSYLETDDSPRLRFERDRLRDAKSASLVE